MESAFPLFRFVKNGWKLDYLASNSYLAWQKTHLDSEGNWKMKKSQDCEDDNKDMEMDKKDKKWKLLEANVKSETPDKRMKEDHKIDDTSLTVSNLSPTLSSSPPVSKMTHLLSIAEDAASMALLSPPVSKTTHLPSITEGAALMALPSLPLSNTSHLPSITEGTALMVLPSPPVSNTSHLPSVAEETTCTNKKEIVPCMPQPEPEPVTVVPTKISVNPLACLVIAANKAQESLPKLPSDPNGSKIENEGLAIPSTTTKSAKGNVKVPGRMRPSPTKNGQNLCALRWLKRIQLNGTMEDFQKYYNSLSADKVKVSSTSSNCPHH
ncbi:hypothetical protein BKA82DRAFT_24469 [Pisolithus tinctorius]|uniref:Uncharacterized protein n=1 Tax=Pisolithus tinctorius Marx 270 TaxID=870435 RepID=A0A0C3P129_PISTI|nr:hypothetical protein BKA82DRAFT_24469 [Pisolithus tinctorius]KIO06785.1 hypothetical protein M404DRAFT_24469 [Pisolithus tinctorius Marx 270]